MLPREGRGGERGVGCGGPEEGPPPQGPAEGPWRVLEKGSLVQEGRGRGGEGKQRKKLRAKKG